jgi:cation transport regulator ChaC
MNGATAHIFAYGSLANLASLEVTLGRPVAPAGVARLAGWRRRWSLARDNLASEKTFARADDDSVPPYCLGLNLERGDGESPNGVLIEVGEGDLERLALRELRYDRVEVTGEVVTASDQPGRAFTYVAKKEHYAATPPEGSVILAQYARAVEGAFAVLGDDQLELFRATTEPYPVELVEGVLIRNQIPPGNPRDW